MATGDKKKVVIVGGGVGGAFAAKSLQFHADVTLIDPKEYFEIPWANLRAMVEPKFAERTLISHNEYLTNARIITSTAINITGSEVLTANGVHVTYDYLIVATGHTNVDPKTSSEKLSQYKAENEKIKSASSILIIGGGPTGVELAGEIAVDYPDKKVTLVHKGSRLLEFIGPKASTKALNWLIAKKVEVVLGQSVDLDGEEYGGTTFKTSGGETIKADCYFVCIGKPLGSSWLKETILKESLDLRGRLMVDGNLRVKGRTNIFGIGDITDIPEIKQGYLAQAHAQMSAKNIKILMNGGNESKLATYKPASAMALVSLGRKEAVAQFPFATVIGWFPGKIKSGDLFVGRTRKEMGLQPYPGKEEKTCC